MSERASLPVLYLIVCAAPPAQQTQEVVPLLQAAGWDVCVIATPQAARWMDTQTIADLSGHVVRTDYRLPGEADPLPKADVMLVMPATFNTIYKWAQGIGDTLVTSFLCEALGRGSPPIIAAPCLKMDLVRHPAFSRSVALQRNCGIHILHKPERYPSPLMTGFHASSQPTHVDQEVQFFLEVNIPLNIGSRSVQMRGRHSAVKIHMNDRMHALLLASGKLSRQRILLDSDALNRHTSKRRVSIHHQAVGWPFPPW